MIKAIVRPVVNKVEHSRTNANKGHMPSFEGLKKAEQIDNSLSKHLTSSKVVRTLVRSSK
jgi:hypothetical protein